VAVCVDTVCSSSLVALHGAASATSGRECGKALVVAVSLMLTPATHAAYARAGMLSADGRCKTFDARANGYARGEGVGALTLEDGAVVQTASLSCRVRSDGKSASLTEQRTVTSSNATVANEQQWHTVIFAAAVHRDAQARTSMLHVMDFALHVLHTAQHVALPLWICTALTQSRSVVGAPSHAGLWGLGRTCRQEAMTMPVWCADAYDGCTRTTAKLIHRHMLQRPDGCVRGVKAIRSLLSSRKILGALEVGAGSGGTASSVLPALEDACQRYVFTDVSDVFLRLARARFTEFTFLEYKLLNIDADPCLQGFAAHQYEIVISTNCLHATPFMRNTLRHCEQLLCEAGRLVVNEGLATASFVQMTFGMTDGWCMMPPTHATTPPMHATTPPTPPTHATLPPTSAHTCHDAAHTCHRYGPKVYELRCTLACGTWH